MSSLRGVEFLDATLVHHTGSMVRFVTRQLPAIPSSDSDSSVLLPDGQEVLAKWHPHPQNPYLAGPPLVRWIKSWIPYGETVPVRVHQVGKGSTLRLELLWPTHPAPLPDTKSIQRTLRALAREPRARRRVQYERWERNPSLRSLAFSLWAPHCQIAGCTINASLPDHLATRLLDIHHLNHVSTGGSDSPLNLAVLCVSHHQLIHRAPNSSLLMSDLRKAEIKVNGITLEIDRDLGALMAALR